MICRPLGSAWIGSALALLVAGTTSASTIRYDFAGEVVIASGIFAGRGTRVSGTVSWDSFMVDRDAGDATSDYFSLWDGTNDGARISVSIQVGTLRRSIEIVGTTSGRPSFLAILDTATVDLLDVELQPSHRDRAVLRLRDYAPLPPDALFPGSANLDDTPFDDAIEVDFAKVQSTRTIGSVIVTTRSTYTAQAPSGEFLGPVGFQLDSFKLPEPTSGGLLALGLGFLLFSRRSERREVRTREAS